jgi:hypothetical protein
MPRRRSSQLVVIYWRDIPSHVNGVSGTEKHQFPLKPRFEKAIDRAAMKAGLTGASDYVAEWRRESRPAGTDITAQAEALALELDEKFPLSVLDTYVENAGFAPEGEQS